MKKAILILLAGWFSSSVIAQTIVGDATLPNSIKAGSDNLILNGTGIREKWFLDIYAAGLYLTQKNSDANSIISSEKAMGIRLHMVSGLIDSQKMIDAVNEGFGKSTNGKMAPIQPQIDKFIAIFKKEEIKEGDIYDLIYVPSKGVEVYKGSKLQDTISGMEFKKALFGIWIGNDPADSDLKAGLLGK